MANHKEFVSGIHVIIISISNLTFVPQKCQMHKEGISNQNLSSGIHDLNQIFEKFNLNFKNFKFDQIWNCAAKVSMVMT